MLIPSKDLGNSGSALTPYSERLPSKMLAGGLGKLVGVVKPEVAGEAASTMAAA
jgi:hypothetical protein